MSITDHKCMATLQNYDPVPELSERFDAHRDIMGGPSKKIRIETVTKTVSKTSVHEPNGVVGRASLLRKASTKGEFWKKKH